MCIVFTRMTILSCLTGALAGCMASGSGSATSYARLSDIPDNGSATINGTAVTTDFRRSESTGIITTYPSDTSRTDSSLTVTLASGDVVAASATSDRASFRVDTRADGRVTNGTNSSLFISPSDQSLAVLSNPDATGLDHVAYGAWMDFENSTRGRSATAVYGAPSASSDVPTSGSARYTGKSIGLARFGGGHYYATESDIELSTSDFETMSISSTNTTGTNLSGSQGTSSSSRLDFSGTGTISGSEFSADVTAYNNWWTGNAAGHFYGTDASEVGGTFTLVVDDSRYIGSFGASR